MSFTELNTVENLVRELLLLKRSRLPAALFADLVLILLPASLHVRKVNVAVDHPVRHACEQQTETHAGNEA